MKGFLLIDKESGMTSFDVVREVRKLTGVKKVGHAGTLDPLATGVMVVAVGEATKLLEFFIGCDKEYLVTAHFGAVSDTYDADGEIEESTAVYQIIEQDLRKIIKERFMGHITQVPPKYSALKVGGKRACDLMRKGMDVTLAERKVNIDKFEIQKFQWPVGEFLIGCSTGTYVRSLVHDLGQAMGCGAYVKALRRLKVGKFEIGNCISLGELSSNKKIEQYFLSLESASFALPRLELSEVEFESLRNGGIIADRSLSDDFNLAFFKGKVVGVLENYPRLNGIKFRKRIF